MNQIDPRPLSLCPARKPDPRSLGVTFVRTPGLKGYRPQLGDAAVDRVPDGDRVIARPGPGADAAHLGYGRRQARGARLHSHEEDEGKVPLVFDFHGHGGTPNMRPERITCTRRGPKPSSSTCRE